MAKKLDRNSIIGRQGVNLVEKIVLSMGYAWNETRMDAGIDGTIEIRDSATDRMTNCVILAQIKSGGSYFKSETATQFTFYADQDDLQYWLDGNAPVVLIVCRPENEEAYWISIREHVRCTPVATRTKIVFQKTTQCLTGASAANLRTLAMPRAWGLHTPPAWKAETLYSNLLQVTKLPTKVYIAPTEFRDPKALYATDADKRLRGFGEFILREGNLISAHDLKSDRFKGFCDQAAIEPFDFRPWAEEYENWAKELMHQMLRELAYRWYLSYNPRDDLFYTAATPDGQPREWPVQGEKKASSITVYKRYPSKLEPERIAYHRHSGFFSQFQHFDNEWYLMLSPTYFFTSDGKKKHSKHEEMLKKMKIFERQKAVYGQLLMWSQRLRPSSDLFNTAYSLMELGPLLAFECPVGIDDAAWKPEHEEAADEFDGTASLNLSA